MNSQFIYCCCQLGAEKALKDELLVTHPTLKFAFSRAGFVTFKSPSPLPHDFELESVFARTWGFSIGPQKSIDDAVLAARALAPSLGAKQMDLHVWERDLHAAGEEPKGFASGARTREWRQKIQSAVPELFELGSDWVLDLSGVDADNPELWLGFHHRKMGSRSRCSPLAGGQIPVTMPEDSPSRAFIKLEQALQWSGLEPKPGQLALEIGSAPGGASYALLLRELSVIGIDPGEMAPLFTERYSARFRHIAKSVSQVSIKDIPESIDWLVLDINAKPLVTLGLVNDLLRHAQPSFLRLQGMILTLKINDWKLVRYIPEWLMQVTDMARPAGLTQVRATQLPANRQEICVVARRRPLNRGVR